MLKNVFPEVFKLPPHFKKQRRMFLNFQIIVFKCSFFKHYFLSKNVKCTSPNNFILLHVKSSKQPLASVNVQSGSKMNQKLHAPTEPSFYDMISVLITFCQICMQFNWVKIFWSRLALPVKELPCPTTNSKSCPSSPYLKPSSSWSIEGRRYSTFVPSSSSWGIRTHDSGLMPS